MGVQSLTGSPSPGDYPLKSLAYLAMRPVPSRTGRAPTIYRATATLSPFVLMASNPHRFTCDINRISLRTHHVQGNRHTLMLCLDGIQSPCTDLQVNQLAGPPLIFYVLQWCCHSCRRRLHVLVLGRV